MNKVDLEKWQAIEDDDMRRSYDTLAAMAENELGEEPTSGALFVFLNRPRNRMKIIYYEKGGFCIWMKRLEAGLALTILLITISFCI